MALVTFCEAHHLIYANFHYLMTLIQFCIGKTQTVFQANNQSNSSQITKSYDVNTNL